MAHFTQIDYDREMAFIAIKKNTEDNDETIAVTRVVSDADNIEAEFAIIVRSDMQKQGVGNKLMSKTIDYCREHGTKRLLAHTLANNFPMQKLAKSFGFVKVENNNDPQTVSLRLELN